MASPKKPETKVVPFAGDPEVNGALAQSLGLNESELSRAAKELGRPPSYAELSVLAALWSERESQKSARVHTRNLPTGGTHVVRGSDDSAGAVDLGDGYCAVFTLESRDTGDAALAATFTLGGAIRDVLATGARPVAALNAMRFGGPDAPATAEELKSTVAKLAAYNKDAGVPLVGGDLQFDARYERAVIKALSVGVARTESLVESRSSGLGNTILCVGARVAAGGEGEAKDAADPLVQRRLTDACLEAYRLGSIDGARAVGGAGLAGAAARLASKGDTGIELDLDALPRKGKAASPAELLTGGSSERLLLVVKKGRDEAVLEALRKHDLEATIIGRITNTGRLVVKAAAGEAPSSKAAEARQGLVADLSLSLLLHDAPSYERAAKPVEIDRTPPVVTLGRKEDAESELVRLVGSCNVGSREWITRRLEASKSGARGPQSDAAVVRVALTEGGASVEKLIALSIDGNGRHAALDPREGAAMAVAECARNIVCTGAEPLGLAHSLTFGDPERPETMWCVAETVDGIRDACLSLKLPVVSGEIGFGAVGSPVTPFVAVVGQLRDPNDRLGIAFARQADMVALLGHPGRGNLAGSEFVVARSGGQIQGPALHIDLAAEVKLQRAVLELARDRLLSSAHDVSDGGIGVTLAECCIAGRIGCSVELPKLDGGTELASLFHEEASRIIVSFPPEQRAKVQERCENLGVPFLLLGFVGGDTLEIEDVLDVPVQVLAESHTRALVRVVGDD